MLPLDLPKLRLDDGSEYRLRHAGLGDMFTLQRLVGRVLQQASSKTGLTQVLSGSASREELAGHMMMAAASSGPDLMEWLDTFAPPDRNRNDNGEMLSLMEYGRLLGALAEHPEILDFLGSLQSLFRSQGAAVIKKGLSKQGKFST